MRSAESRRLMTQAELRALQAQINPHFLFNALNTIYGLIHRENDVARKLVLHLADLFRFFFRPEQMLIPVDEEVRIVRAYLEIEQARLGPKLQVTIDVADDARRVTVPSLCIQPLVENAVKHGAAKRADGGLVALTIVVADDRLPRGGGELGRLPAWRARADRRGPGQRPPASAALVRRRLRRACGNSRERDVGQLRDSVGEVRWRRVLGSGCTT